MKGLFKKLSGVFLLALFIFPQVEKEIHAFQHSDEIHCTSAEIHLHSWQHNCSICDFFFPSITDSIRQLFSFDTYVVSNIKLLCYDKPIISVSKYFNPLRAPPVIS